jgi:hypothetical protein
MRRAVTRRGALALLGALAGCNETASIGGSRTRIDGAAVRALAGDAAAVPERLPVGVGSAHLAAGEKRVRTLLDAVPADLGAEALPNGAMRERIVERRRDAVENLDAAASAATPFERLGRIADARGQARFAAGAWRAVDAEATRDDLTDEAAAVRDDRAAFRNRWAYRGGDPVVAVRVHAEIERRVAGDRVDDPADDPQRYRAGNPLGVGEAAGRIERVRTAVDDAAHQYDRLLASVEDPVDLHPRFLDARRAVRETFESERGDLPRVDAEAPWRIEGVDVEETPAAAALAELYRSIDPRHDDGRDDEPPACALHRAHASLIDLRAFASLRARVAAGETVAIESVDDVAAVRREAVGAVRDAAASPSILGRTALADTAARLRYADDRLTEVGGEVRARRLRGEVTRYLVVAARARAVPGASERAVAALRS